MEPILQKSRHDAMIDLVCNGASNVQGVTFHPLYDTLLLSIQMICSGCKLRTVLEVFVQQIFPSNKTT
jgi:hypothetical protein